MRTSERLRYLKAFLYENLCQGRQMKAPAPQMKIDQIVNQEPKVFLAWAPARMDQSGILHEDTASVVPGIILMPNQSYAKNMEEKRFDRYNNVHRPPEMGQQLSVSVLFGVYEPGIRLPGFSENAEARGKGLDMTRILEGTEEGLFTLTNWMDDCMTLLLGQKMIPHTDLVLDEATVTYSLYTDQSYVVDKRPIYYGFINATFQCYAEEGQNPSIEQYLN